MSIARDFIVFGRTRVFYVTDDFNIGSGIVEVVDYIQENGNPCFNDIFTIKIKENNEISYIELERKDVFFDIDKCKEELIKLLKEHIRNSIDCQVTITNLEGPTSGYLYENDADIFKDNCIQGIGTSLDTLIIFDKNKLNPDKSYKLILKNNDKVYSTPIINVTIYNGLDNMSIDGNELTIIDYPEDYNDYKLIINDIPLEYNNYHIQLNISYSDKFEAISSNLTTNIYDDYISVNNNRFESIDIIDGDLTYWVPEDNKHYTLTMQIISDNIVEVFEYNDYITKEDFLSDMPLSFASFNGEN